MPSKAEIDKLVLDFCRAQIEQQLGWGSSESWTHGDYQKLSDAIFDKTRIQISHNTLKRLWGKLQYSGSPTQSTRDALARFAGYADLDALRKEYLSQHPEKLLTPEVTTATAEPATGNTAARFRGWTWGLTGIGLVAVLWYWVMTHSNPDLEKVQFRAKNPVGEGWPHTVKYRLNRQELGSDSVRINFHDRIFAPLGAKSDSILYTYYMPNYYKARLYWRGQVVGTQYIQVKTKNWEALGPLDTVLSYFPKAIPDTLADGRLYLAPRQLNEGLPLPPDYYVSYRNVRDFDVDLDDIDFRARVKNSRAEGGLPCHNVMLRLCGSQEPIDLVMMNSGCVDKARLFFGPDGATGRERDLSALGQDFSQYRELALQTSEQKGQVLLDGQVLATQGYGSKLGSLKGIIFWFKGTGSLDWVEIRRKSDGKLVYREDF